MSKERTELDARVQGAANRELLSIIIDPIRRAARNQGYAVAVHGSLNRDIDLIAVPWCEGAMDADSLVTLICGAVAGAAGNCSQHGEEWTGKPHGRKSITLMVYVGEKHTQLDLSVMPRVVPEPPAAPGVKE